MNAEILETTVVVFGFIFLVIPVGLWVLSDILAQKRHERATEEARTHNPRKHFHITFRHERNY